jgi:hypothetical protein
VRVTDVSCIPRIYELNPSRSYVISVSKNRGRITVHRGVRSARKPWPDLARREWEYQRSSNNVSHADGVNIAIGGAPEEDDIVGQ